MAEAVQARAMLNALRRASPASAQTRGRGAQAVRAVLRAGGLEVRRIGRGQRWTMREVLEHYRGLGLHPSSVIDVGVATGTPDLYAGFPDARLLLIEPLREWEGAMRSIAATRRADIVIAAAGTEVGSMDIAVHRAPVCSSMLGGRPGEAPAARRTVPVVTVDDVVAEHDAVGPFVLKADVEGAELEVLGGAQRTLESTELVLLEVALFELVPGMPLLHDVVARMHDLGFVVGEFYDGHNRPLDGSLAVLDIAFVRADGRFRREQAYATPGQADELYRSWGF